MLPDIEFTLNATVQKSIGVSPAEVVFGRTLNRSGWFEDNRTNRDDIIKKIKDNQQENVVLTRRTFNIGDEVWVTKEIRNKDQDKYEGPFKIVSQIHDRSYRLKSNDGKELVRNVEKLKIFKKGGCKE